VQQHFVTVSRRTLAEVVPLTYHTYSVLNKYAANPGNGPGYERQWNDLWVWNVRHGRAATNRDDAAALVLLVLLNGPATLRLATELVSQRLKLCRISVGKAYERQMEDEIAHQKSAKKLVQVTGYHYEEAGCNRRIDELKQECKQWRKCDDTYRTLDGGEFHLWLKSTWIYEAEHKPDIASATLRIAQRFWGDQLDPNTQSR